MFWVYSLIIFLFFILTIQNFVKRVRRMVMSGKARLNVNKSLTMEISRDMINLYKKKFYE